MRLHHVQVSCPPGGEDAVRLFYGTGLGLHEVDKPAELAGRGGVWFRAYAPDATTVTAELHVGVEKDFRPALKAHPAFVVNDRSELDQTTRRLEDLGFVVDRREQDSFPGFARFHVNDPHGNRVEVVSVRNQPHTA